MKTLAIAATILVSFSCFSQEGPPIEETAASIKSLTPKEHFQFGVKSYNMQNFTEAQAHFAAVVLAEPHNSRAHYNLGLVYLKQKHLGLALGHLRKANFENPRLSVARKALDELETDRDSLIKMIVTRARIVPLEAWAVGSLVFAGLFIWGALGRAAARRRFLRGGAPPTDQSFKPFLIGIGFVVFFGAFCFLAWDSNRGRATVVASSLDLKSGPTDDSSSLLELKEGIELLIQEKSKDWFQVEEPRGLSGWVPAAKIMVTTGDH